MKPLSFTVAPALLCPDVLQLRWRRRQLHGAGGQRRHERANEKVAECRLDPKPVQQPHLPILVGGHSAPALRRAARYGNGWYGFAINPA